MLNIEHVHIQFTKKGKVVDTNEWQMTVELNTDINLHSKIFQFVSINNNELLRNRYSTVNSGKDVNLHSGGRVTRLHSGQLSLWSPLFRQLGSGHQATQRSTHSLVSPIQVARVRSPGYTAVNSFSGLPYSGSQVRSPGYTVVNCLSGLLYSGSQDQVTRLGKEWPDYISLRSGQIFRNIIYLTHGSDIQNYIKTFYIYFNKQ